MLSLNCFADRLQPASAIYEVVHGNVKWTTFIVCIVYWGPRGIVLWNIQPRFCLENSTILPINTNGEIKNCVKFRKHFFGLLVSDYNLGLDATQIWFQIEDEEEDAHVLL